MGKTKQSKAKQNFHTAPGFPLRRNHKPHSLSFRSNSPPIPPPSPSQLKPPSYWPRQSAKRVSQFSQIFPRTRCSATIKISIPQQQLRDAHPFSLAVDDCEGENQARAVSRHRVAITLLMCASPGSRCAAQSPTGWHSWAPLCFRIPACGRHR
jgi:hypothetical protein